MIITDDEKIEKRLNSEGNLALKLGKGNRINHTEAGRNIGDNNLHPVLRSIISAAAQIDTAKKVSETFDVSPAQAHNLKHGKTTGTGEVKEEILDKKREILDEVQSKASDILLKTLGIIPERLDDKKLKAKDISSIAKDMAHIIEKTRENKEVRDTGPRILIITAPLRPLETYETIEIGIKENQ